MAKPETTVQKFLREQYNYTKVFGVGLLADFEGPQAESRFDFYNKIGTAIKSLEKRLFLPHVEVPEDWGPKKVYDIVNEIVVPSLDLALFYGGLASADTGMMLQRATREGIPVICFYEKERADQVATLTRDLTTCVDTIIFEDETRGIERLKEAVAKFYKNSIVDFI